MAGHRPRRDPGGDARNSHRDANLDRVRPDDLGAAEMVAATYGLGQMVLKASNTDIVIIIMGIVAGAVAYLFDLLMRQVERVVVPWKGKA